MAWIHARTLLQTRSVRLKSSDKPWARSEPIFSGKHLRRANKQCLRLNLLVALASEELPSITNPEDVSFTVLHPIRINVPNVLSEEERKKLDTENDIVFWRGLRFQSHTEEHFRQRLTEFYARWLTDHMAILELCSGCDSHLPSHIKPARMVGYGLDALELSANPALNGHVVQDLNMEPVLKLPNGSFNAVLCSCGVQYLQRLEEVTAEVYRVLQPGGCCIISFDDSSQPSKACRWWKGSLEDRAGVIARVLRAVGFTKMTVSCCLTPGSFCAVVGERPLQTQAPAEPLSPALAEMSLMDGTAITTAALERWRAAYAALSQDARQMGIPASAIPQLPPGANVQQLGSCYDHLQNMIASFLSSGL